MTKTTRSTSTTPTANRVCATLGERFESTNSSARNPAADLSTNMFASRRKPAMGGNFDFAGLEFEIRLPECGAFLTPFARPDRPISLARTRRAPRPQSNASDHLRQCRHDASAIERYGLSLS